MIGIVLCMYTAQSLNAVTVRRLPLEDMFWIYCECCEQRCIYESETISMLLCDNIYGSELQLDDLNRTRQQIHESRTW